jgi:hypothetical protein
VEILFMVGSLILDTLGVLFMIGGDAVAAVAVEAGGDKVREYRADKYAEQARTRAANRVPLLRPAECGDTLLRARGVQEIPREQLLRSPDEKDFPV